MYGPGFEESLGEVNSLSPIIADHPTFFFLKHFFALHQHELWKQTRSIKIQNLLGEPFLSPWTSLKLWRCLQSKGTERNNWYFATPFQRVFPNSFVSNSYKTRRFTRDRFLEKSPRQSRSRRKPSVFSRCWGKETSQSFAEQEKTRASGQKLEPQPTKPQKPRR
jgi:hypothetical protein